MKKFVCVILLAVCCLSTQAQNISYVESTRSWYYIYDANGKRTNTMSESTVGKVLSVSGDTFTSQVGSWIYTWSKDGKKINTRAAK